MLRAGYAGGVALACTFLAPPDAVAVDDKLDLVERLVGGKVVASDRVHLMMPAEFPTGYTVPMDLQVDSPMSEDDYVRSIRVFAPANPIIEVARFNFVAERSIARVSTRIRLAKPQHVVAVAEMNDGTLLMAKSWIAVASNGCA
jgi:sulfur-oxidizing protein SoxY